MTHSCFMNASSRTSVTSSAFKRTGGNPLDLYTQTRLSVRLLWRFGTNNAELTINTKISALGLAYKHATGRLTLSDAFQFQSQSDKFLAVAHKNMETSHLFGWFFVWVIDKKKNLKSNS